MSKTIIVTGAAGTLGSAVVQHLLNQGHTVIGTVSPGKNNATLSAKKGYEQYELDVSVPSAVQGFIQHIARKYEVIDAAALLVGGFAMGNIRNSSLEDVQKMLKLNFETTYITAQAIFLQMEQQPSGGHIMMVGAKPALETAAGLESIGYTFSKSLVFTLADIINKSGKKQQVKATVIVPSILDTPSNRQSMPQANFDNWVKPEAAAEIIGFLVADQSAPLRDSVIKIYGNA